MKVVNRLLLGAALALGGIHGAVAQEKTNLTFAASMSWLGQLPIMVAIDKGFFAEQGINVKYENIVASGDRLMAVTSGAADFSNLGRTAVVSQISRGNDSFSWFGNIDQAPGAEGCYATGGIHSIAELKGKRVAANTSAEFTMAMLLKDNGLSHADIKFFDLPPGEIVTALQKGDVDAVCIWQPYLSKAAEAVPGGKVIGLDNTTQSFKRTGTVVSADLLIISKKLVKEKPAVATGLSEAVFKGVDFIHANPDEAAQIYQRYSKADLDTIKTQMKLFQYIPKDKFAQNLAGQELQLNELAQWLLDEKKTIRQMPNIKAALDTSFLKLK
ncbi:MAG: ABC transporter substrate-binding protein [Azonexus sp.]|jgi:NitT/TauT family transport system substrate-binding protein|nr:ABC transporter substrate-binding protein [Azonexus sp.]